MKQAAVARPYTYRWLVRLALPLIAADARSGHIDDLYYDAGFLPLPRHFYYPIPEIDDLEARGVWDMRASLAGCRFEEQDCLDLFLRLCAKYGGECSWKHHDTGDDIDFTTSNRNFSFGCAASTHMMLRDLEPRLVIEIGSGNSSKVIAHALEMNGGGAHLVIDPYPSPLVTGGLRGRTTVIQDRVEVQPLDVFAELGAGDVLFIDSTHVVRIGGDVNFELLELLPRLAEGVVVHIHDVSLPYEYDRTYARGPRRYLWTEQYLLQAFLTLNDQFEVLLPMYLIQRDHADEFAQSLRAFDPTLHTVRKHEFLDPAEAGRIVRPTAAAPTTGHTDDERDHVEDTLVLGGGGFVGRAIQRRVAAESGRYVFAVRADATTETHGVRTLQIDLLDESRVGEVARFNHAIWVAGNANHGLGWSDPSKDIASQVITLLRFLRHFTGILTMLSSQAVYFGLSGGVREDVDHVPNMPYGFAKLAAEQYARWALEAGRLDRLWIHRLMYAFGEGEKPGRLLPRCFRASREGGRVTVAGGGRSFLNPLPVGFLADVLVESAEQMRSEALGFTEVTNVNHPEPWTVLDVVNWVRDRNTFDLEVVESGEHWPVTFHGSVNRLLGWLDRWDMAFPDVRTSLLEYEDQLARRTAG